MPAKIFLLSPANVNGLRAKQLASPRAKFDAAVRFRSPEGVPIADAFAFMSALYFRGKITYARHFADPKEGIFVITSGFGLVPPDWPLNEERMKRMQKIDVERLRAQLHEASALARAAARLDAARRLAGHPPRQRGH